MECDIVDLTDDQTGSVEADSDSGTDIIVHTRQRPSLHHTDNDPERDEHRSDPQGERDLLMACFDSDMMSDDESDERGFRELVLKNFVIYNSMNGDEIRSARTESLDIVASNARKNCGSYRFDGTLFCEKTSREAHLENITIADVQVQYLSFHNNDQTESNFSTKDQIWIVTAQSWAYGQCYYRLKEPSTTYKYHFESFVWLTDFTRLVFEYLEHSEDRQILIGLSNFREDFYHYLTRRYGHIQSFWDWHMQCGPSHDFRRQLTSAHHAEFIFDQIHNIQNTSDTGDSDMSGSKAEADVEMGDNKAGTDNVLSDPGPLQPLPLLDHPLWMDIGQDPSMIEEDHAGSSECSTDSDLSSESGDGEVDDRSQTTATLKAATCFLRAYPSWGPRKHNLLRVESSSEKTRLYCNFRMEALKLADKYAKFQDSDFTVLCGKPQSKASILLAQASQKKAKLFSANTKNLVGQAVIVRKDNNNQAHNYRYAYVRGLTHRGKLSVTWLSLPEQTSLGSSQYPIGKELFFTNECTCDPVSHKLVVSSHSINVNKLDLSSQERCDLFAYQIFIARERSFHDINIRQTQNCLHCNTGEPIPCIGVTASEQGHVMENISCFSGCGLLEYGMRQGSSGMIRTIYTAETDTNAVRSIVANCRPNEMYAGMRSEKDVNEELTAWIRGTQHIPHADCFTAGPPCQGFSKLNGHREKRRSQKNCSAVALALSVVEILLPKMVLIENVLAMNTRPSTSQPSAAEQALSFLVSLGYQAKLCEVSASSLGATTVRRRLFIVASVPGIPLPETPEPTHGVNGLLGFSTASQVTSDLPPLDNDTGLCPRYPDHIPLEAIPPFELSIIKHVPKVNGTSQISTKLPNLHQIRDKLTPEQREWYAGQREELRRGRNVFRRIHPHEPFETITTKFNLLNARGPRVIHWNQDRILSFEELRRYHGVPKEFLLIGNKQAQLRQLGNSVAYDVGYGWGRTFYRAWRASRLQDSAFVKEDKCRGYPGRVPADETEGNATVISSDEDE